MDMNAVSNATAVIAAAFCRSRIINLWIQSAFFLCLLHSSIAAGAEISQTDWFGGPGVAGPVDQWEDTFQQSTNLAWRSIAGQMALAAMPVASPPVRVVAGDADHPKSIGVGDLDGDGINDLVSSDPVYDVFNDLGAIYWWRLSNDNIWEQHIVDDDFYGAWYVDTADVDLDGDMDIIATAYYGVDPDGPDGLGRNGRFAWFENLHGDASAWSQHVVGTYFWGGRTIDAGDLDGDGDVDLVGASELTNSPFSQKSDITWFENLDGVGGSWAQHNLEENAGHGWEAHIADVDGDGALDIVSCEDGRIAWFDNANGDGSSWLKRTVTASLGSRTFVDIGDIDNDGDTDLIGGSTGTVQIGWWDNTSGTGSVWFPRYVVDASGSFSIDMRDVDGDGDVDALIALAFGGVYWLENTSGNGIVWNPRLVNAGFQGDFFATLADANTDGRLDAVCSDEDFDNNNARQLAWFELTEFVSSGDMISSVLDAGDRPGWGVIDWDALVPGDTALDVLVRASNDPFNLGAFMPVESPGQSLDELIAEDARYLQYRLLLDSDDADVSPVIYDISVTMRARGDANGDGDVDLADHVRFGECLFGPNMLPDPPPPMTTQQCLDVFDFDLDDDVDVPDFAAFGAILAGE